MHSASPRKRRLDVPAPLLVLAEMSFVQFGAANARTLIRSTNAIFAVCLRQLIAGTLMLLVLRPAIRGRTRTQWLVVLVFALALVAMNTLYYAAIARIPLGVTTTIEFLGPLTLAAVSSRRPKALLAVVLALAGVVAVSGVLGTDLASLDGIGLLLALVSGAGWALHILTTRALGRHWQGLDGLALGIALAGVMLAPASVLLTNLGAIGPNLLAIGVLVAIFSSIIPYSIAVIVLRRVEPRVFGILMSLEPGVAAVIGFLVLGQALVPLQVLGMGLVIAASALVMADARQDQATALAELD